MKVLDQSCLDASAASPCQEQLLSTQVGLHCCCDKVATSVSGNVEKHTKRRGSLTSSGRGKPNWFLAGLQTEHWHQ